MIAMHDTLLVLAVLVLTAGALVGAAAVATGWLPPGPGRGKVLRPRLWGYGTLIAEAGMGTFIFLGPLQGPGIRHAPVAAAGMAVFFAGLYVQVLAGRPGGTIP
jgi:hypothetical protein